MVDTLRRVFSCRPRESPASIGGSVLTDEGTPGALERVFLVEVNAYVSIFGDHNPFDSPLSNVCDSRSLRRTAMLAMFLPGGFPTHTGKIVQEGAYRQFFCRGGVDWLNNPGYIERRDGGSLGQSRTIV